MNLLVAAPVGNRMIHSKVVVLWKSGLHLRPAAALVRIAKQFRSNLHLKCGSQVADLRSIFSIVALSATMGTCLEVEANGEDEQAAIQAIEHVFSTHNNT